MTNKLTLNDDIQSFFDTDDKELWNLILDNKIEEIKVLRPEEDNFLYHIVKQLFAEGKSEALTQYDFVTLKDENSVLFKNLVRLIFALDVNGNYDNLRLQVDDKLFEVIPDIVKNIKEQSAGYPRNPMNALVWAEGAGFRSSLNALIYYYRLKENIDTLHFLIMNRTQITLSIMGHYRNLVGPDMLESADIKEKLGQTDAALSFYKAIQGDFKNELKWFLDTPEAGPNEEDVISLESLKKALQSIDRLSGTNEYTEICSQIDEVLSREHVEIPDFDEDDDEE